APACQAGDSRHYSLTKPLPILPRDRGAECAVERTPLLRHLPAALLPAEVGAPTRAPARRWAGPRPAPRRGPPKVVSSTSAIRCRADRGLTCRQPTQVRSGSGG